MFNQGVSKNPRVTEMTFCRFLNHVTLSKDKAPAPYHYFIYYISLSLCLGRKRSSPRSLRQQLHASLMQLSPPLTPAWFRPVPHRLPLRSCLADTDLHSIATRSRDFEVCARRGVHKLQRLCPFGHARAQWPPRGARLFQTGTLPTHRCPVKPGKRGKRPRDCASCRRKRQPSQTLAGLIPPSLPREVQ